MMSFLEEIPNTVIARLNGSLFLVTKKTPLKYEPTCGRKKIALPDRKKTSGASEDIHAICESKYSH